MSNSGSVKFYPVLGRGGLGNMLFPWARAVAYAYRSGGAMIQPMWWRPRLGPFLRRESDKRDYHRDLRGPGAHALIVQSVSRVGSCWIDENEWIDDPTRTVDPVVRVEGMTGLFAPFVEDREVVAREFNSRIRQSDRALKRDYYAMHVRLGDYVRSQSIVSNSVNDNVPTPIDWFVAGARILSERQPRRPVVVCSDGTDEELAELLQVPGVVRSPRARAIADLQVLANSRLILASNSTFSAWGSFMGDVPIVFRTGEDRYAACHPLATTWAGESQIPRLS